jgi:hypothetical protein
VTASPVDEPPCPACHGTWGHDTDCPLKDLLELPGATPISKEAKAKVDEWKGLHLNPDGSPK